MAKKSCSKCQVSKELSDTFFHIDRNSKTGFRADCRECRKLADKDRRARLLDAITQVEEEIGDDAGLDNLLDAEEEDLGVPLEDGELDKLFESVGRITGKAVPKNKTALPQNPQIYKYVSGKAVNYENPVFTQTIVVLSDVHVPDHDPLVWKSIIKWIAKNQPNEVVLNGDFLELSSCSQHGGMPDIISLESDFAAGRAAIAEILKAAPEIKITLLEGNHENRLNRFILAKAPSLFGALTISSGLRLDTLGIEYVAEGDQPIQRGTVDILHGHQLGSGKGASLPKHHAMKLSDVYGKSSRTAIIGHSHRPQTYTKAQHGGNATAIALGCLRTLAPQWLHGSQAGWEHQFAVIYVLPGGPSQVYPVTVTDGSFIWAGEVYDSK